MLFPIGFWWVWITLRIVDAQSRVAGAGIAINQQISSNFDGLSALWPAAPPEPRGSGSSISRDKHGI